MYVKISELYTKQKKNERGTSYLLAKPNIKATKLNDT
jgi:hypothetical protein